MGEPGCLACDLTNGNRPLPGGSIWESKGWIVEHCVGPLPLGTLIVKPRRHVLRFSELTASEAGAFGPVVHLANRCVRDLVECDQIYNCQWSHSANGPVHIHFVVQPVMNSDRERFGGGGPGIQAAMFAKLETPDPGEVSAFANEARSWFTGLERSSFREPNGN